MVSIWKPLLSCPAKSSVHIPKSFYPIVRSLCSEITLVCSEEWGHDRMLHLQLWCTELIFSFDQSMVMNMMFVWMVCQINLYVIPKSVWRRDLGYKISRTETGLWVSPAQSCLLLRNAYYLRPGACHIELHPDQAFVV